MDGQLYDSAVEVPCSSPQQNNITNLSYFNLSENSIFGHAHENFEMHSSDIFCGMNEMSLSNVMQEYDFCSSDSNSASMSLHDFQELSSEIDTELKPLTDYDSIGEFCFESDHVALKENSDYKKLLHVIIILEAKRAKAIRDVEKLIEMQNIALADPLKFVRRLQRGEDIGLPGPQRIPTLPTIDWSKYTIQRKFIPDVKRHTRYASKANRSMNTPNAAEIPKDEISSDNLSANGKQISPKNRPATFNLPWTAEEQKRLEDLLLEYPPEKTESRRWEKIATALGNRTPTQVASRVQKYFIKLTKAGIPVPGRAPNINHLRKPKRQVIRQQPSTFLVSHTPTVYMLEEDEDFSSNYIYSVNGDRDENSSDMSIDHSDDEISPELKNTAEYKEYVTLKKALQENMNYSASAQHIEYKCNRCGCEPIIGIRWHCTDCDLPESVDYCENCVDCIHESGKHTNDHHLEPVHRASSTFLDRDYMHFLGSDHNYLDPNYMPAT